MRLLPLLLVPLIAATACSPRPLFMQPRPVREWPAALQAAQVAAREGRYAHADSLLAQFASRNPGSYEARQAAYWRALFLVDPANTQGSQREAVQSLNQYFADGSTADSYDEATVLRRVMQHADSLTRTLAQARQLIAEAQEAASEPSRPAAAPAQAVAPAVRAETRRDNRNLVEEVRRLRDELSKANQELERVRRRLSEQRP